MIEPRGLRAALGALPAALPAGLAAEDAARLRGGFYGPLHAAAGGESPSALYVGGRSGLEALAALHRSPTATVLVVEPDAWLRGTLADALGQHAGARVVATVAEALAAAGGRGIGFARIDAPFCDVDLLALLERQGVGHLCGLFRPDRIDPLALYRRSRDQVARSFFWREADSPLAFGGDAGPVEVEVSVVVPAYRVSAEIDRCLASLAAQEIERLEVIVVDDGSPDDTGARAAEWAARHPGRIRVLAKPNGGCASARMVGLAAARGEYVGFVDGDDWADARMFEGLYQAGTLGGAEIAQCGFVEAHADGVDIPCRDAARGGLTGLVRDVREMLVLRPTIWRRIYRRDFLLGSDIRFPEHIRRFDDLPFQFEALARAKRTAVLPDPWYFYRQGRVGQDVLARDDRLFVHFEIFDWLRARVSTWADAAIERQLLRVELNTHLWALGRIEPQFSAEYRRRAQRQLLANRVHLPPAECLAIAARMGRRAGGLMLGAAARHGWARHGEAAP